ncbi:MAG: hypothetical protein U1F67_16480 [Rubrivivax sp.]
MLGMRGLDARGKLDPRGIAARAGLARVRTGRIALQIALAPQRQRLHQRVPGFAHLPRQQARRRVVAVVVDVHQLDAQHRVGQGTSGADALGSRVGLAAHRIQALRARESEQARQVRSRRRVVGARWRADGNDEGAAREGCCSSQGKRPTKPRRRGRRAHGMNSR